MEQKTKNNIKIILLLLIVFIILYAFHISFGDRFEDQYEGENNQGETQIIFSTNTVEKTLTVTEIYAQGRTLHWSEIVVANGSATLPYGPISVGDVITDCEGYLKLELREFGVSLFETDFR